MGNPLLYVSKPKVEIKNKPKPSMKIDIMLVKQLEELYQAGRRVLCEFLINGKIVSGFLKKENDKYYIIDDEKQIDVYLENIEEINVLKI